MAYSGYWDIRVDGDLEHVLLNKPIDYLVETRDVTLAGSVLPRSDAAMGDLCHDACLL